jgi:hypothetical protein
MVFHDASFAEPALIPELEDEPFLPIKAELDLMIEMLPACQLHRVRGTGSKGIGVPRESSPLECRESRLEIP